MQLVQFVLVFFHSGYFLLDSTCECPKPLTFLQCGYSVLFFAMFYSFYLSAYRKEQKLKKAKLEQSVQTVKSNEFDNHSLDKLAEKPKDDIDNAQIKKIR